MGLEDKDNLKLIDDGLNLDVFKKYYQISSLTGEIQSREKYEIYKKKILSQPLP